jgi:hypothetical protein
MTAARRGAPSVATAAGFGDTPAPRPGMRLVLWKPLNKGSLRGFATVELPIVSGTAGITGSADTILVLKREPKDSLGLLYVRGRDVPEAEIAMQFDEATGKWLRLTGADDFRRSKERNAIIRVLLDLGEPMTPAEIAGAIGKSRANGSVRVLLLKMRKTGDVVRCADGRYTVSGI